MVNANPIPKLQVLKESWLLRHINLISTTGQALMYNLVLE